MINEAALANTSTKECHKLLLFLVYGKAVVVTGLTLNGLAVTRPLGSRPGEMLILVSSMYIKRFNFHFFVGFINT